MLENGVWTMPNQSLTEQAPPASAQQDCCDPFESGVHTLLLDQFAFSKRVRAEVLSGDLPCGNLAEADGEGRRFVRLHLPKCEPQELALQKGV